MSKKPSANRANRTKVRSGSAAARRQSGHGRVTPKGTRPASSARGPGSQPAPNSRYTPPVPRASKVTAPWVPFAFFGLLGIGVIGVFLNYLSVLPGAPSWWWLGGSLACVFASIMAATQFR